MTVPKLRFKEFDGNWDIGTLGTLFSKRKDRGKDGLPTYSVTLNNGIVNREDLDRDTVTNLSPDDHLLVKQGDLAYNMMRMWQGALGLAPTDGLVSPAYVVLKPIEGKANTHFFEYYFKKNRQIHNFWAYSQGLTEDRLRLYFNDFKVIKNYFPIIEEQTKIASFLSAVDEKISQLNQKYELLRQYKQGMMQKLFSQQLRFKADDGSEFGEWEETTFDKLGTFLKGKGISKADIVENGLTPCIRYGELYTHYGEVISKVISATNIEAQNLVLSKANDVLIPASGETQIDIATASCVLDDGIALSGDLNIFRTQANGVFLSYLIRSHLKMKIAQLAQGNSVVHLYSSQLKTIKLNLPCLEEQTKIANFLSAIDQKIEVVAQQIEQAKTWKKGLLQQMFV